MYLYIRLGLLTAISLLFAVASSDDVRGSGGGVITACVQKTTGSMRVVAGQSACGPAESPITWNSDGVQGPPGPDGPPGIAGPSGAPMEVLDANATVLGILLGSPQSGPTFVTWNDKQKIMLQFFSEDGTLFSPCGQFIYFEQPNCTGAGWIPSICHRMLLGPILGVDRYVAATEPPTIGTVNFQSRTIRPYSECQNVSGQAGGGQFDPAGWAPLREISAEDLGYSLPRLAPLYLVPTE